MSGLNSSRALACLVIAAAMPAAWSEIRYDVTAKPDASELLVTVQIPTTGSQTDVQIPHWAPGAYVLRDTWKEIKDLAAKDRSGADVPFSKPDDLTWRFQTKPGDTLTVSYDVPSAFSDGSMHYSGPSTYVYVVGRKKERCNLQIHEPTGWRIAVGMNPLRGSLDQFQAPTYDVLADNPVTMGDFLEDTYTVAGKTHFIAMRGAAKTEVDRQKLKKLCSTISTIETTFFGGAPYDRYVWHFTIFPGQDGGGGLEHLSSTEISLSSGVGRGAEGVLAHEFFHLWNVKRIRAFVLGPFDYTKLPETGALWWLEGVTDYYAHSLPARYGMWTPENLYVDIARNLTQFRAAPGHLRVSPYDSSYKVDQAAGGRGNSNGLDVSYYNSGFLLGTIFDLNLLSKTHGKRSLDDVIKALWAECRNNQPGFPEDGIRTQLVRIGGPEFGPMYDEIVMKPGDLPLEQALALVGLQLQDEDQKYTTLGFTARPSRQEGGLIVTEGNDQVKTGEVIKQVENVRFDQTGGSGGGRGYAQILAKLQVGTPITIKVLRNGAEETVKIDPIEATRKIHTIAETPNASAEAVRLRNIWLSKRHPG